LGFDVISKLDFTEREIKNGISYWIDPASADCLVAAWGGDYGSRLLIFLKMGVRAALVDRKAIIDPTASIENKYILNV
jgi:hypothetical protein